MAGKAVKPRLNRLDRPELDKPKPPPKKMRPPKEPKQR